MFDVIKKSIEWGEETLTLETGKVARQADGTVIATLGETSVMANVTFANEMREGQDFFPLTVHYQEKYYAAGKIPGGFFKREARPPEAETLTVRTAEAWSCSQTASQGLNSHNIGKQKTSHNSCSRPSPSMISVAILIILTKLEFTKSQHCPRRPQKNLKN